MIQKSMRNGKNSSKKAVYSSTSLPQETRKISNKQSNLAPKWTRERKKNRKLVAKEEIIKSRAETNERETKK